MPGGIATPGTYTTHQKGNPLTSVFDSTDQRNLDRKIAVGIERISQVLKSLLWEQSKTTGLSPIQIQFLIALAYEPEKSWTVGLLAQRYNLTPATVSDALSALENKNLLVRTRGEDDKRTVVLSLTTEGKRLARKLGAWLNALRQHVGELDDHAKPVLLASLMYLIAAFQKDGLISATHMCATCTYFRPNAHAKTSTPHHCAYIDKAFGDAGLRIDCPDYEEKEVEA